MADKELTALSTVGEFNAHHRDTVKAGNEFMENAIQCGRVAVEAKANTEHGQWEAFVGQYYEADIRVVQGYMALYRRLNLIPKTKRASFLKDATSVRGLTKAVEAFAPKQPKQNASTRAGKSMETLTLTTEQADAIDESLANKTARPNASTAVDASQDSAAGSGGGVAVTPPMTPAAGDETEAEHDDPCPNCGCTEWDEDGDGWACNQCSHPWGEPAGDIDKDQLTKMRKALVSYLEHAMRQADDINARTRFAGHETMIDCLRTSIEVAKAIK